MVTTSVKDIFLIKLVVVLGYPIYYKNVGGKMSTSLTSYLDHSLSGFIIIPPLDPNFVVNTSKVSYLREKW